LFNTAWKSAAYWLMPVNGMLEVAEVLTIGLSAGSGIL
jgi:hypothetical protein